MAGTDDEVPRQPVAHIQNRASNKGAQGIFHGSVTILTLIPRVLLWLIIPSMVVLIISEVVTAGAGVRNFQQQLREWGFIDTFPTEQPGETLIVIAPFHRPPGVTDTEPHIKIRRALTQAAQEFQLHTLRVELAHQALSADDRAGAEHLAKRYNASIVIWGEDTDVEVIINFLSYKQLDFDARQVTITERSRARLANPSAYASFITTDLPNQMSFLTLFAIGQSYIVQDWAKARSLIEHAVGTIRSSTTIEGLADAYFRLGWLDQVQQKNPNQVIAMYEQAIRLDPQYALAYNNRGIAYADQGKLNEALADFNEAIRLDPQVAPLAYTNRGRLYADQGKLNEALADFNEAIRLDPRAAMAYNNRGSAYADQGKLNEALADFNEAIRLDPRAAMAYNNRGSAYLIQRKLNEALADFNEAIRLDPKSVSAYYNRGTVYADQGKLDDAIANFNEAIRLDPQLARAYYRRGLAYYAQGKRNDAIANFNEAIRLDPQLAQIYYSRGTARSDQGDLTGAIADFNEAIRLDPQYAQAYNNRGNAYYTQAYNNRGNTQYTQGKLNDAIADFNEAIRLDPQLAQAYYNRGLAYYAQDKRNDAIADFKHVLQISQDSQIRKGAEDALKGLGASE